MNGLQSSNSGSASELPSIETVMEEIFQRARAQSQDANLTLREWVDAAEAWRIVHALREARGNRSQAAKRLGIGRRTLYSKMQRLGIAATWRV